MKNIIFILALLLIGCGNPTPKVTPDKLPNAVVDHPYSELVYISNGVIDRKTIDIAITPGNSGLTWTPKITYYRWGNDIEKSENFHQISIHGTPIQKGKIKINIEGFTYGTMYAGKEFNKLYEINVE